ncbi:MAG: 23S rRNA (guanosine(2251)-2'-O)-methyltransferase RlmB [Gammaproteobacteria bacterium]|nr:23S rRNA (guanosine(2251)-2'-O)-methyltransferase RlmB [Gammaproteobacteria bacterium]
MSDKGRSGRGRRRASVSVGGREPLPSDIVYGQHAVAVLLERRAAQVVEIWLQAGRDNQLSQRLRRFAERGALRVHELSREALDQAFPDARHQGVVVRCETERELSAGSPEADGGASGAPGIDLATLARDAGPEAIVVALDGVQDPRNLGAVLRCCDAVGVLGVLVPRSRGTALTPAARKVASGAAESVPVLQVANLARALAQLADAGFTIVGTGDASDRNLFETSVDGPLVLVLGSEDKGVRRLTREHCDLMVRLPMAGAVNSLNVSVAAGVCLYELRRRQAASAEHPTTFATLGTAVD